MQSEQCDRQSARQGLGQAPRKILRLPHILAFMALLPFVAEAAEPRDLAVQNFRPAMDSKGFVTVERSKALGTFEPSFGLFLNQSFSFNTWPFLFFLRLFIF